MALTAFAGNIVPQDVLHAIAKDGAAIVHDFVSPDLLARLNDDLADAVASVLPGSRSDSPTWTVFHGSNTKRFAGLCAKSPAFVELIQHPLMNKWAHSALTPVAGGYWLNTGQAMLIGPGETPQMLHRDQDNWPLFSAIGATAPEVTVSCMVALSDFDHATGAARVIPGSHLWNDYSRPVDQDDTVAAEMPAGSALLYSGKVIHGGGANSTIDTWRRGLHMSFVVGWLTPEEAHTIAVPWTVARTLPQFVQQLLGYASYDPGSHPGGRLWLVDFEDARGALL